MSDIAMPPSVICMKVKQKNIRFTNAKHILLLHLTLNINIELPIQIVIVCNSHFLRSQRNWLKQHENMQIYAVN